MANPYINLYKDNPTADATNGVAISTGNTFTAPVYLALDAALNETKTVQLAIRTEPGYRAEDVTVAIYGSNSRFTLSKDNSSGFGSSVTFSSVADANQIFYAKATSAIKEQPQNDRSTKFRFSGKLKLVSS